MLPFGCPDGPLSSVHKDGEAEISDAVTNSHLYASVNSHCFSGSFLNVLSVCIFRGNPTEVMFTRDGSST